MRTFVTLRFLLVDLVTTGSWGTASSWVDLLAVMGTHLKLCTFSICMWKMRSTARRRFRIVKSIIFEFDRTTLNASTEVRLPRSRHLPITLQFWSVASYSSPSTHFYVSVESIFVFSLLPPSKFKIQKIYGSVQISVYQVYCTLHIFYTGEKTK